MATTISTRRLSFVFISRLFRLFRKRRTRLTDHYNRRIFIKLRSNYSVLAQLLSEFKPLKIILPMWTCHLLVKAKLYSQFFALIGPILFIFSRRITILHQSVFFWVPRMIWLKWSCIYIYNHIYKIYSCRKLVLV